MPDYRCNRVPGGTYFFTVTLLGRRSSLLVSEIGRLREAVARTLRARPFHIDAWVVLPDHLHAMWTLPEGDDDYSGRWRAIKKRFSWAMPATERRSPVQLARAERGIWQRRFWDHTVRNARDNRPTWITSISTRSSMVLWHRPLDGRFQVFIVL